MNKCFLLTVLSASFLAFASTDAVAKIKKNAGVPEVIPALSLNEVVAAGIAQWDGKDWIELYNDSDEPLSLKGFAISRGKGKNGKESASLDSLTIAPKSFLVLKQHTHFGFDLSSSGDCIGLSYKGNQIDRVCYDSDLSDKALARKQDGKRSDQNEWVIYPAAESTIGSSNHTFTFIYTSDQHYGIKRSFRGKEKADSQEVNQAMVAQMNRLDGMRFPQNENAVYAGMPVQVNYLIQTGDITSRSEKPGIPVSAVMMNQFEEDYLNGITLTNVKGIRIPVWFAPGNHDLSNAIGHARIPEEKTDKTAMVEIYNAMMQPEVKKSVETFNPETDKVNFLREIGGIQFVFVQMWPDKHNREWIESRLDTARTAFLFTHDQPDVEAKHLKDPTHTPGTPYSFENKFEYLVDEYADQGTDAKGSTATQQRELADFLKAHPNIRAYFHGNENYNEFYTFEGPDKNIALPVFRVDSPMKGVYSEDNEKLLSFQLVTVDKINGRMTVREVFWNSRANGLSPIEFGDSKTIDF